MHNSLYWMMLNNIYSNRFGAEVENPDGSVQKLTVTHMVSALSVALAKDRTSVMEDYLKVAEQRQKDSE